MFCLSVKKKKNKKAAGRQVRCLKLFMTVFLKCLVSKEMHSHYLTSVLWSGGILSCLLKEGLHKYLYCLLLMLCNRAEGQKLSVLHPNSIFTGTSYKCYLIKQMFFN